MRTFRRLFALGSAVAVLFVLSPSTASAGEADLASVRNATAAFHNVNAAQLAGYFPLLSCFDLPGVGGMGQHYVNTALLNGKAEIARPQAVVYEVDGNKLKLGAVEWIIPISMWSSDAPPHLLGHDFTRLDSLGLWALHAWIWKPNPLGMFANYNPSVGMCPGH